MLALIKPKYHVTERTHDSMTQDERLNVWTHGAGAAFALTALAQLVVAAGLYGNGWHIVSFSIFGASLLILYTASTVYHSVTNVKAKRILQRLDHVAIYLLIAGTYTPFTLVAVRGALGWTIFGIIWGMALMGILLEIFRRKRTDWLETLCFLIMGWLAIIAIKSLFEVLSIGGICWLVAGGLAYSLGTIFYLAEKLPYNHAIWHIFVLLGSICHFTTVLVYLLPLAPI